MTILANSTAHAVVPVTDLTRARTWWVDTLGLTVAFQSDDALVLEAGNGSRIVFYTSEGAGKAPNTIVDFSVENIERAVHSLADQGIEFERYDGLTADESGIVDMGAMRCAWITDPDGNCIGISQLVAVTA